jgi:hypothetical protein
MMWYDLPMPQPLDDGSSVYRVTNRKQALMLIDHAVVRYLLPFLGEESSAADAARSLDVSLDVLLPRVRRFVDAGVLRQTGEVARKGRPIKLYRAIADEFFVPSSVIELSDARIPDRHYETQMEAAFLAAVDHFAHLAPEIGLRVYRHDDAIDVRGAASSGINVPFDSPQAPPVMREWRTIALTPARAKRLQGDLLRVLAEARADHDPAGDSVMLSVRMVPLGRTNDTRP